MHVRSITLHLVAILAFGSAVSACSEELPPRTLFDEEGAWSVVQYNLGDGLEKINAQSRKDAFMLSFDAQQDVLTTAACGNEMSGFTPTDSSCVLSPSSTSWACRCFSYAFEEDVMQLVEFEAGSEPPKVEFDSDLMPGQTAEEAGGGESGSGESGESGAEPPANVVVVSIAAIPERQDTYDFRPLPAGVFGGDGVSHSFIVEARSNAVFDRVYNDPQRGVCEPCVPDAG